MKAYLANQQPLNLAECLGEGGEGRVFALAEAEQQHAVKIYHQLPSPDKQAKLKAMAANNVAELSKVALWPTDLVYNENQKIIGFVMPILPEGSVAIHRLYNPSQRKQDFPQVDYAFLVHAARNLAAAFAYLHSCGHCVGDVNQGNAVVAPDATITLIDCDSFQIEHQHRIFACEVGVAHFTPPELHGQPFGQITKTTTHDNFGLAILIFHLLMMGRHPFAGVYLGEGEMPIEKAITEFRYAYSQHAKNKQIAPPPNAPLITWLPAYVFELFEDSFDESVDERPTAEQWLEALEKFEQQLISCDANNAHKYYKRLSVCPWCQFYSQHKVEFFSKEADGANVTSIDNLSSTQSYEIKKQLDLINIPHFSATLTQYPLKDHKNLARFTGDIAWSFSVLFMFVYISGVSEFTLSDFVFFALLVFLGSFVFSAVFWLLIFFTLIYVKFSNKKLEWLLDFWLASSGYFNKKKNYFLGRKRLLEFGEVWQNHVLEGEKIVAFKTEALALCDDYNKHLNDNKTVTNQIGQLKELADKLPTLPLELRQKISEYQDTRQQLLDQWQRINHTFIKIALSCQFRGNTLFPEEEFFNDSIAKANRHIIPVLLSVIIAALLIIGLWHLVAKEFAPQPEIKIDQPKPVNLKQPLITTQDWYALDKQRKKEPLDSYEKAVVVDTEKKLMWINSLPQSTYEFYPNYIEPNPASVAIPFLLMHLNVELKYMGYDDWRLPTSAELKRLSMTKGLDKAFYYAPQGLYASGNQGELDGIYVDFTSGDVGYDAKGVKQLRLVRDVTTEEIEPIKSVSNIDIGSVQLLGQKGEVLSLDDASTQFTWCAIWDKKNNLVWAQPHRFDGFPPSISSEFTFFDIKEANKALGYIKNVKACGFSHWHIPSMKESVWFISLRKNHFPDILSMWMTDDNSLNISHQLDLQKLIIINPPQKASLVLVTKYQK